MIVHLFTLLLAILIDRVVGDPDWLWKRLAHPVALFGRLIAHLDREWNDPARTDAARRLRGIGAVLVLLLLAALIGALLHRLCMAVGPVGIVLEALVASLFLAHKSLADHVRAVGRALRRGGLGEGRQVVSRIVGRDPDQLDEAGVCRAAIESLAENASDGVVAPFLFFLVAGLPGLLAYKALNTADSMIGHMSERHRAFGWAAARFDDVANLLPARLTALGFAFVAPLADGNGARALRTAWRDARLHRSPNAGWPECAVAGALDLSLGGPRRYGKFAVDAPELNAQGRREADVADIGDALKLFARLGDLLIAILVVILAVSLL